MAASAAAAAATFAGFQGLRKAKGFQGAAEPSARPLSPPAKPQRLHIAAEKKGLKRAEIILVEDIPTLGKAGELLSVKKGYFRNYLYPLSKAKPATPKVLKQIKLEQDRKELDLKKIKEEAESVARKFQTIGQFVVRRKVAKGKGIFGSVSVQDVVDIIKAQTNRDVEKKDIELPEIKEIGFYDVTIRLHPEVVAVVKLNVTGK